MAFPFPYKVIACLVLTTMTRCTTGTNIMAFLGDSKVLQWKMNPLPPSSVVVSVHHPLIIKSSSGSDYVLLYSMLGTSVIPGSSSMASRVSNTGKSNTNTGNIEFTLNDIRTADAGDYRTRFNVAGQQDVTKIGIRLIVYVKPSNPTVNELSSPVAGKDMTLNCSTQSNSKPEDHGLQMHYKWYRNGADLHTGARYITSGSQLQVKNIQRSDTDTVFTCEAFETESLVSDFSAVYTVDVEFGPVSVTISPSSGPYIVKESSRLNTLTCTSNCNPICTFIWERDGSQVSSGNVLNAIENIKRDQTGQYVCKATNNHGSRELSVTVIVKLKPSQPTITAVSPPVVGNEMTLNCVIESNSKPDDHGLKMKYKWYRNGAGLPTGGRYVISGSQLHVKNIQRTESNTVFYCSGFEVESLKSEESAVYTVVVQYGPDSITISPSTDAYTVRENDNLNSIICTSSCNPACNYTWERNGIKVSIGQVLNSIRNIRRGQAGQYVCKVTNKHGNKESSVTVVVQYSPDKPVLRINGNNADVRESLPITFTCTTQSVPHAKLTIYGSNMTSLYIQDNTLTSTFTIPRANCLDTGLLYCSAENVIGNSKSNGVNVNVLCKPRPDHRVSQVLKQGYDLGDTMNISGALISNPKPTIYWSMRPNGSSLSKNLTNSKDNFLFHIYWKVPSMISQATRTYMRQDDFGEYLLHTENQHGKYVMVFKLTQRRRPYGPELTSLKCNLKQPVEITFKPKFDGGDKQIFFIEMKSNSEAFKGVDEKQQDNNENEITMRGPIIESRVVYVFRVAATNKYGTTSSNIQLSCTISNGDEEMYRYGIAMLIIGILGLLATISVAIILYIRRKLSCPSCCFQTKDKVEDSKITNIESQHYQNIRGTSNISKNGQQIGMAENRNIVNED